MKIKEPKFGTIVSVRKQKYVCIYGNCKDCAFVREEKTCAKYECRNRFRKDGANVIFKKIRKIEGVKFICYI